MPEPLIHQHIRAVVAYENSDQAREEMLLASYEANGERIISGGQTGPDTWDVTDYRTGELLAEGDNGLDGYCKLIGEVGQNWVHIDPIIEALNDDPPKTEGLPESLCEVLLEWVEDAEPEEIEAALK